MPKLLLVLVYHRVYNPDNPQKWEHFQSQIHFLKEHYHLVLPGQELSCTQLNVLLTFDDAYADFYYYAFPFLKKLQVPAVLGVPTAHILEDTHLTAEERIKTITPIENITRWQCPAGLCTWKELRKITRNRALISIAAHGHQHMHLKRIETGSTLFSEETLLPKKILEQELNIPIQDYIYPYGSCSQQVHHMVKQHYRFCLRAGNSLNFSWPKHQLLYRIDWQQFLDPSTFFWKLFQWKMNYFFNRLRNR